MISYQSAYVKMQRLSKSNNPDDLIQLKQDWNTGYHMFNAKLARYFARKQQFTDLVAAQSIYQVPIDCVRVIGITVTVTSTYKQPLIQVRDEREWRQITSYPQASNYITHFYVLGNSEVQFWPTPSQSVDSGIRFYYQPQDHDLSLDDVTSVTTSATATVTNGSATVLASASVLNPDMASLSFQVNGVTDLTWYPIVSATTTTLLLQTPFVGNTSPTVAWTIGQPSILPQEYDDAPMHYALGNYFMAQGNLQRSAFHLGTVDKPGMFYQMIDDCKESYASSSMSSVIAGDELSLNPWLFVPPASA